MATKTQGKTEKNAAGGRGSVKTLEERKLALITQMRELKAEMARLNVELHNAGASAISVVCWE